MNCPYAGTCGGCSRLHEPYSEQIEAKEATLRRLFGPLLPPSRRSGGLFLPVPILGVEPMHFRQKVSFVFGTEASTRRLIMGHYRRGSQRLVSVDECAVHSERGNRIAFALFHHLERARISAAGPSLTGLVRHLIVRTTADDRQAVAMLVVTQNDKSLRAPVRALLDSPDRPDGFFININTDPGPFMVGDRTVRIDGTDSVREVVGGVSYLVSPATFFQTNVAAAAALQHHVVESAFGAERVLDLYCGSGLFSLPLAAAGVRVTGVEENPRAVEDAQANAKLNQISSSRVRFITSRTEDAVRRLANQSWDAVILDPPRQGCSDAVLEAVFQEMAPPRVTYVSCNPSALAAELSGIVQCGYHVDDLRAVDMFPHTDHIEAIVTLSRAAARR